MCSCFLRSSSLASSNFSRKRDRSGGLAGFANRRMGSSCLRHLDGSQKGFLNAEENGILSSSDRKIGQNRTNSVLRSSHHPGLLVISWSLGLFLRCLHHYELVLALVAQHKPKTIYGEHTDSTDSTGHKTGSNFNCAPLAKTCKNVHNVLSVVSSGAKPLVAVSLSSLEVTLRASHRQGESQLYMHAQATLA